MTWLRVLTALGILAVAASALLVFALCTAAARGDRRGSRDDGTPGDAVRDTAEQSGLIRRTSGES
ncbi:hypothetical protein J5Y04_39615 [Kitasatospora sp. RG8]|uniref:hypothetical protein n=1 Tax=Kitasatospora sp. RG8 TaxID=2820815 RepID=UPI001ADF855D|nr:hypothetical protein [Kitasatospora sp. RG8]MBP0455586.1 hypothetical protein [Kitasatospora sp. RG8]